MSDSCEGGRSIDLKQALLRRQLRLNKLIYCYSRYVFYVLFPLYFQGNLKANDSGNKEAEDRVLEVDKAYDSLGEKVLTPSTQILRSQKLSLCIASFFALRFYRWHFRIFV